MANDNDSTALLVVDVQNYFVNDTNLALVHRIARHIKESDYQTVTFSQFVNAPDSNYRHLLDWHKCAEPPDTDIHPLLQPFSTTGNTFSKSGKSALKSLELQQFLKQARIKQLKICGLDSDDCVLGTAYEAFDLGYRVEVIEELCTVSHQRGDLQVAALKIIRKNLNQGKSA